MKTKRTYIAAHGTQYRYTSNGCRCIICRAAHATVNKRTQKTKRLAMKTLGFSLLFVKVMPACVLVAKGPRSIVEYERSV